MFDYTLTFNVIIFAAVAILLLAVTAKMEIKRILYRMIGLFILTALVYLLAAYQVQYSVNNSITTALGFTLIIIIIFEILLIVIDIFKPLALVSVRARL